MSHQWPSETAFTQVELDVVDRACPACGRGMHVCGHRVRRLFTLQGPWRLRLRIVHCPDPTCAGHDRFFNPEGELSISQPWWVVGWDVFAWMGHRRLSRHWSVPQIRHELRDRYGIQLSEDAIEKHLRRYQTMLAARHQDLDQLRAVYADTESVVLTIDGLQPEKGHETLYVVRELVQKRVWFAEPLISSTEAEVRRLFVRARELAEQIGKRVVCWMSDKEAFVKGVAAEFPGVPHRYCQNHFLRDVAQPVLEQDSHAKVQMRSKIRGLRGIEREVLQQKQSLPQTEPESLLPTRGSSAAPPERPPDPAAADVVLDYCAAVRGILNDDQGGPLHPPGIRMADALGQVRESLQRNLDAKKGGPQKSNSRTWRSASIGD
jgi:hypothetical protein